MSVGSLLPEEVRALAQAVGLLDEDGDIRPSWFEHPIEGRLLAGVPLREVVADDVGAHRLGAQHRHTNTLTAVVDGQPLGERDRCRLRNGVRARVDLCQQACGRRGREQVALSPGDHAWYQRLSHV